MNPVVTVPNAHLALDRPPKRSSAKDSALCSLDIAASDLFRTSTAHTGCKSMKAAQISYTGRPLSLGAHR